MSSNLILRRKNDPPNHFSLNLDELENLSAKKWGGHFHPSPLCGDSSNCNYTFDFVEGRSTLKLYCDSSEQHKPVSKMIY